eukprot:gnl/TRDRNA2_/TRDRNA2_173272_c1_seq2.p1 gnl/TRDRNA2_/TRDRNA2_173272_c1~~gnl/TRDRNA2_/TRDRNA2_173272_c1_seq2.p1  ORF type:complete len:101 (+),score=7.06 gnl/TRDRNA2_/TRDRNA2_173272_c1_seq2:697-999(+)
MGQIQHTVLEEGSRRKCCKLCGAYVHGLAPLLAECDVPAAERGNFLSAASGVWSVTLNGALPGDWPTAVPSLHSGISRLVLAVRYAAALTRRLRDAHGPV